MVVGGEQGRTEYCVLRRQDWKLSETRHRDWTMEGIVHAPLRSRGFRVGRVRKFDKRTRRLSAHKLLYANPFSWSTAFAASPTFTQSRRTKFGARPFANWVQLYEWARILWKANSQNQMEENVAPYSRSSRISLSRIGAIWDNETVDPK